MNLEDYTETSPSSRSFDMESSYSKSNPLVMKTDMEREKINARERQRMHQLNRAMEELRSVLPQTPGVCKLSKMSTLQAARNYIVSMNSSIVEMQQMLLYYQALVSISGSTTKQNINLFNKDKIHHPCNKLTLADQTDRIRHWAANVNTESIKSRMSAAETDSQLLRDRLMILNQLSLRLQAQERSSVPTENAAILPGIHNSASFNHPALRYSLSLPPVSNGLDSTGSSIDFSHEKTTPTTNS